VSPDAMTTGDVVEMCEELADIGIGHVIFNMPNDHEITPLEAIGREVIPRIKDL